MRIQIINQETVTKTSPKTGKPYTQLEVAYKGPEGKVEGRNIMSFGATKSTFDALALARSGEFYDVQTVKNDRGYNDWVGVTKVDGGQAAPPSASALGNNPYQTKNQGLGNATPKSNYETPEERQLKQIYIVRQSSISNAINTLSVGSKSNIDVDKVLATAKRYEDFVFGIDKQIEVDDGTAKLVAMSDDEIPY